MATDTGAPPDISEAPVPVAPIDLRSVQTKTNGKVPSVFQLEALECGAACLAMILASHGRWVPLEELREKCGVSRDGVSANNMMEAALEYGLVPMGHRVAAQDLSNIEAPAVIWWRRNHFVVLEKAARGKFRINDPANGRRVVDSEEFLECYSGAAITFTLADDFQKDGHKFHPIPNLRERLKHSSDGVWLAFLAGLLAIIPGLLLPVAALVFVNDVLIQGDAAMIPGLVVALLVAAVLAATFNQIQAQALARLQAKIAMVGTGELLEHLLRMPMQFFWQRSVGDLAMRVDLPTSIAQVLAGQIAGTFISCFSLFAYGALMLYFDVQLAIVVFLLALVNLVMLRIVVEKRTNAQRKLSRDLAEVEGITVQMTQTIETIKASGSEDAAFTRWSAANVRSINAGATMAGATSVLQAGPVVISALTQAAILVIGGFGIMNGDLNLGVLVAFQTMAAGINGPIGQLVGLASEIQVTTASLERVDDVTKLPVDSRFSHARPPRDPNGAPRLSGRLEMRNITFGYGLKDEPLVRDFSLTLEPGRRVALVGVSGAGKTTIANIAAGLIEPWSGEVLYGGKPLREIPIGMLEGSLAKVDQKIMLFNASVRDNVSLFDGSVSDERIMQALDDAQLLTEILTRPGGLSSMIAEGGRNLSGGQQQRLELARALIHNPTMLILDEATSALDTLSERAVDEALRARGCSCLIVAHRLSTIRDCDEIVVLERGGQVVERGTHPQLMAMNGRYAELLGEADMGGDIGV